MLHVLGIPGWLVYSRPYVYTVCAYLLQLMLSGDDLKELGMAMGHRKKLASLIAVEAERQRLAEVAHFRSVCVCVCVCVCTD